MSRAAASAASTEKMKISGRERSTFTKGDHKKLKAKGILAYEDSFRYPGDEMIPAPAMGGGSFFSTSSLEVCRSQPTNFFVGCSLSMAFSCIS